MEARNILIYLSILHEGDWDKIYQDILDKKCNFNEDDVYRVVSNLKCQALTLLDDEYPPYLKEAFKPPFVLYYYGDLSLLSMDYKRISVVGSRQCSEYGKQATETVVGPLAKNYVIVSGLAKGIDAISHKCAINNGGKTIAILGCGIDKCYPLENLSLYKNIKENHLLISEYPGDTSVEQSQFPFRNRLIAQFSRCLIVTEAKLRSGTSITVGYALKSGSEICCVPYHIDEESLCNRLISEGATLIQSAQDVINQIESLVH